MMQVVQYIRPLSTNILYTMYHLNHSPIDAS
jgi:hypothetical protein